MNISSPIQEGATCSYKLPGLFGATNNTVLTSKENISLIMPSHPRMVLVNYLYKFIPIKDRALQLTATCQMILLFLPSLNKYNQFHLLLYKRVSIERLQVEAPLNAFQGVTSVFVLILPHTVISTE